jgi:hypothetical protein
VSPLRRITAKLLNAAGSGDPAMPGVWLAFQPEQARLGIERIDDFAALGPPRSLAATQGLGKVLRILRAARLVAPTDPMLLAEEEEAAGRLMRAVGTRLVLDLAPRSRLRFVAWTESGVEVVEDVTHVFENEDAFVVYRRTQRLPVHVARTHVVRQVTECVRWYEVRDIERAPAPTARARC